MKPKLGSSITIRLKSLAAASEAASIPDFCSGFVPIKRVKLRANKTNANKKVQLIAVIKTMTLPRLSRLRWQPFDQRFVVKNAIYGYLAPAQKKIGRNGLSKHSKLSADNAEEFLVKEPTIGGQPKIEMH